MQSFPLAAQTERLRGSHHEHSDQPECEWRPQREYPREPVGDDRRWWRIGRRLRGMPAGELPGDHGRDLRHRPPGREGHEHGTTVEKRKLVIVFELAKKKPDGSPFVLAMRQTWSMHEKANFYKLVTNITGAKFKEGEKFNPLGLLALPVMVNVTNTSSGDKTYHDIGNVSQFPEGFRCRRRRTSRSPGRS
jgi:hypothetical protein